MNAKNLTIGGALVLLACTLIARLDGLITDEHLLFTFFSVLAVTLSASVSYLISWAATDGYKKYNWLPSRWKEQAIKKKIFKIAWVSAGLPMGIFGAAILVFCTTGKLLLIGSAIWTILVFLVAFTSPWLWAFMVDSCIPRLRNWARGKDNNENEALDRPSEVPKE